MIIPFLGQAIEAVIIVVVAFFLLKILNHLLIRVIGARNEVRRRAISNVKLISKKYAVLVR